MNKVYFIGSSYLGCNYVRLLLPMWENGWNGNKTTIIQKDKPLDIVRQELEDTDIVVFHRPEKPEFHKLAKLLKSIGKKIVFDNDDTYDMEKENPFYGIDAYGVRENIKSRDELVSDFIGLSDLVTTTTKTLAEEYGKLHDNVAILPNCINLDDWYEPERNEGHKIRIGVTGSVTYTQDVNEIKEEIQELSDRDDVELVVFGLQSKEDRESNPLVEEIYMEEYKFWDSLNIEHVPWVKIKDYNSTLNELKLDIMLIPRKDCYFNKCKSNVKFLEAAMCEIPVMASSFEDGPYEDIPENAIVRMKNEENWMPKINQMIENTELRRGIGRLAKQYTLDNFNIEDRAHLWAEEYDKLK